jgi:hypothetical protein
MGALAAPATPAAAAVIAGHGQQGQRRYPGQEYDPGGQDKEVRAAHAALLVFLAPRPGPGTRGCRHGGDQASGPHRPAGRRAAGVVAVWSMRMPGTGAAVVAW